MSEDIDLLYSNLLARFVLRNKYIRHRDNTVKPDAFIPHPYLDLSVTEHGLLSQEKLWLIGKLVAKEKTLYGRADTEPKCFQQQGLSVVSAPAEDNPNHINITGWPNDKSRQKDIALEIASRSKFVAYNRS